MSNKNLYLSLDEHGNFESNLISTDIRFIAGLLYDSSKEDFEVEKKRIKAYYVMAVNKANELRDKENTNKCRFPRDIHLSNVEDNAREAKIVNKVIVDTLPEFIKLGTFNGRPITKYVDSEIGERKGNYHLFVMAKNPSGKSKFKTDDVFTSDNQASTLYFHMASSIVNRIICHNPIYSRNHKLNFYVDLPSRVTAAANDLGNKRAEYEKAGYSALQSGTAKSNTNMGLFSYESKQRYSVANKDIYRSIISYELDKCNNPNVKVVYFDVDSIKYDNVTNDEFLYLCDSICSYIGPELNRTATLIQTNKSKDASDESLNNKERTIDLGNILSTAKESLHTLNPGNINLVYAYDNVDDYYRDAYDYYEKGQLFEAISTIYDAMQLKNDYAKFYSDNVFKDLLERINQAVNVNNFRSCVLNLGKALNANNLNQKKLLFMLEKIEKMKERVIDQYSNDDKKRLEFEVSSFALSAYCHMGMPDEASKYYLECLKSEDYITFDKIIEIRRKYAECLNDNFMFDEAYKLSYDNKKYYEGLMTSREGLLNNISKKEGFIARLVDAYKKPTFNHNCFEYAKTVSNVARCLAYKRDKKAEKEFKLALSMMNKEDANYKITQSYLLHYYADNNMVDKFENEATEYFNGNSTYEDRYNYIMNLVNNKTELYSVGYMIYIFIRGYCVSNAYKTNKVNLDKMIETLEDTKEVDTKQFPWPIIFKYAALINDKKAEEYLKKSGYSSRGYGKIVTALSKFQVCEVHKALKNKAELKGSVEELESYLKDNFVIFKDKQFPKGIDNAYNELSSIFTYMTR